jgi:hypothetical protein
LKTEKMAFCISEYLGNKGKRDKHGWVSIICYALVTSFDKFHQESMLWSQFSAIFANFRRKNWRFSHKPMLR